MQHAFLSTKLLTYILLHFNMFMLEINTHLNNDIKKYI